MERVYIIGGLRSYIGVENGIYKNVPAEFLGAQVLKHIIKKYFNCDICSPDLAEKVDMVIAGNAVGAGGNITRLMMLETGMPYEIPAYTIDLQCGSGLQSVASAASMIKSGYAECIIAGGFESCSTAPRRGYNKNHIDYEKYGGENSWYKVSKFTPGRHFENAMLYGAEKTAISYGITREELDKWVLRSHELAVLAQKSRVFDDLAVEVKEGCSKDEGIRERMSKRLLDRLPYVLENGRVLTAANACLTNDGAAFLVLCSESYLRKNELKPVAEFIDVSNIGGIPLESPRTAVLAIEKLLLKNKLDYHEISVYECNEAFAVIDELFARKYPDAINRYNIFGGALAYGHPYGASGGIIMLHALKALEYMQKVNNKPEYAICSIAAAGGIGTAVLIRRIV